MEEDDYLAEACYYLSDLKLSLSDIARELDLTPERVENAIKNYKSRIDSGRVHYDEDARDFWSKNLKEGLGEEKITLVDEKGRYYHGWKSEIENMTTEQLVNLLVINKTYSERHPLSEFSKTQAVVGYDPLIPLRNIRRSISIIDATLQKRESEEANP